jgi:myo-inositol-1(or 4)-monophosphatase
VISSSSSPSFKALLDMAHTLADRSRQAILPYFRKPMPVENKGGRGQFDPVTAADRAAERTISTHLRRHFPDHGITGEEFGDEGLGQRFRWVIDPIDGTRAFITGTPMWGTLIGLLENEQPFLGMMDQPFTQERFWSGAKSAHLRSADGKVRRLKTRACQRLRDAALMSTSPDLFAAGGEADAFHRVKAEARMTRYGGDCYAYCLLAAGLVDLVIEAGLKSYDVVALIPIVERAGGRMTTWDGTPAMSGGRILASGDPRLHDRVLKILNP